MRTHTRTKSTTIRRGAAAMLALAFALTTAACATGGDAESKDVTIIVHDSFVDAEVFEQAASEATGYDVSVVTAGDGSELTSQLVLTQAAPVADAFFGVDLVFASRIADGDVSEPYLPQGLSERAERYLYDPEGTLVPIDLGATCINIDPAWFADHGLAEPATYEDLTEEQYRGLTVVLDPTSSSTGASFLIGTIAEFGEDGFVDYWERLIANDARIEQSWDDAYYGQFTQGGDGTFPIVVSYSSSPAYTLTEDGSATTTKALLDTCSSQVEYAGVLHGAANPEGAKAVVDYLSSREFQDTIADTMYVYPIDAEAYVPAEWEQFAPLPSEPHDLSPAEIGAGREAWLKAWSAAIS